MKRKKVTCSCGASAPDWMHKMSCYISEVERAAMKSAARMQDVCPRCKLARGFHSSTCDAAIEEK